MAELGGFEPLRRLDAVVDRRLGLSGFGDGLAEHPTYYCETLEEFLEPMLETERMGSEARARHLQRMREEAEQSGAEGHGTFGVNWPGRGCYLNGWLFARVAGCTDAREALRDEGVLPLVLSTAAHEKLGHGWLGACTEAGREVTDLQLWRYGLAERFHLPGPQSAAEALHAERWEILFHSRKYTEEGWATWIERAALDWFAEDMGGEVRRGAEAYSFEAIREALDAAGEDGADDLDGDAREALDRMLGVLGELAEGDGDRIASALLTLQQPQLERRLDGFCQGHFAQPFRYVLGASLLRVLESKLGIAQLPAALAIAGNLHYDLDRVANSDLARIVSSRPAYNADCRLALLGTLSTGSSVGAEGDLMERAAAELGFSPPRSLT